MLTADWVQYADSDNGKSLVLVEGAQALTKRRNLRKEPQGRVTGTI